MGVIVSRKKTKKCCDHDELKQFLQRRCISYRKLAAIMGMGVDSVNAKLNGYRDFTLTEIVDFSIYFHLSESDVNRLFFEEERARRADILANIPTRHSWRNPLERDGCPF